MLIPAILKKDEIIEKFKEYYYSKDLMYETGCLGSWYPNIEETPDGGTYQFAIVDSKNSLIGYFGYSIDWYVSSASGYGLISFSKGNPLIGIDIFRDLNKLINEYGLHRIEWRMIGGNPVERAYDRFCTKYKGTKHVLKDAIKDRYGAYRNEVIYEIILESEKSEDITASSNRFKTGG